MTPQEDSGPGHPLDNSPIGEQLHTFAILTRVISFKFGCALGVNATDLSAMEQLICKGPLTPGDLAAHLGVTTAASTQIVDRLERCGHVTRERQITDRRKVRVVPSAVFETQARTLLAPLIDGLDSVVSRLDDADRKVIENFLAEVIEVYRQVAGTAAQEEPQ